MNEGLPKYLEVLSHELRDLPEQRREEELCEVRQHLEAIVARLMDGGLSETEAVEAATAQFGAARKVGRELKMAGKKGEPWWRAWAGAVGAGVLYLAANFYAIAVTARMVTSARLGSPEFYLALWIPQAVFVIAPLVSGFLAARVSPERGGRALLWLCGGTCGLVFACLGLGLNEWRSFAQVSVTLLLLWLGSWAGARGASRSTGRADAQHA